MVLIFMVWEMAWVDLLSPLCLFRDDSLTPKEPIELAENFHSHPPATRKKITRLLKCTRLKFRFLNVFDVLLTDVWTQIISILQTEMTSFDPKFRFLCEISTFEQNFHLWYRVFNQNFNKHRFRTNIPIHTKLLTIRDGPRVHVISVEQIR